MLYQVQPKELIYAAVTGKAFKGTPEGGLESAREDLRSAEALRAYTIKNATAAFEDGLRGSLEAGKLADITVFDRNLLKIAPEDIANGQGHAHDRRREESSIGAGSIRRRNDHRYFVVLIRPVMARVIL